MNITVNHSEFNINQVLNYDIQIVSTYPTPDSKYSNIVFTKNVDSFDFDYAGSNRSRTGIFYPVLSGDYY